ncbi:MAG: hypothetical protein JSS10_06600 [Verrucomicrobia bacterium]|nr:hypothetical protein [Verrucomicrobiota bacterium]
MAPLTKIKHGHSAPSKIINLDEVKSGSVKASAKKETTQTSYQQAMQMTFAMLFAIALNMGKIGQAFSQSQSDQAALAQSQAETTHENVQKYLTQLAAYQEEQKKAHAWGIFGDVMKWVGIAVSAVVGALLCETPAGFAILAVVIGLTASGLLNKGLSFVGDKLGGAMGSKTWGNIFVQVLAIAVLTVATAGAEAGYTAVVASKAATAAADAASEAAVGAATKAAEDATQTAEQATSALSNTDKTNFGTNFKNSLNGYATRTVGVTTLASTNVVGELVQESIEHIPGNSTAKEWVETCLNAAIMLTIALVSFKGMSENESIVNQFTQKAAQLKTGLFGIQGAGDVVTNIANGGNAWTNYVGAGIQKGQGPIEAAITNSQGMLQIFSSLTSVTQEAMKAMMQAFQPIFTINFGAGWDAATQALA